MSRTPAAELARLKIAFPEWSIRRVQPGKGTGFTAHRQAAGPGPQARYAATLAELEQLLLADGPWRTETVPPTAPAHRR